MLLVPPKLFFSTDQHKYIGFTLQKLAYHIWLVLLHQNHLWILKFNKKDIIHILIIRITAIEKSKQS